MLPWLTPASVRPFMPLRDGSRMRQGADICSISSSFVRGLSQARTLRLGPLRQALQRYYTAGTLRVGSHVREVPQRKEKQVAVEGLHQNKAVCQLDRATSYQFRLFVWNTKSFVDKITVDRIGESRPPSRRAVSATRPQLYSYYPDHPVSEL